MASDKEVERIFKKQFSNFKNGVVNVEGVIMPSCFTKIQNRIEEFEVENDDIWIHTYPKNGTTWTQEMVWLISHNLDFEGAKQLLFFRCPFLDLPGIVDFSLRKNFAPDPFELAENLNKPRNIKCHLPYHLLPKQIRTGVKTPRIVYVARNPKDVCVSYYYHSIHVDNYPGTLEEFCELFLRDLVPYGSYWIHVLPMWQKRHEPNILFLRYEDMKKDLPSEIRRVAKFLNVKLTDGQVEKLKQHLSFESMKNNPAVNYEEDTKENGPNQDIKFMRSGIVGDHKNKMSPEMIKRFDEWIDEHTKGTDLKFED